MGELKALPVPEAISKTDMMMNLHFDDYRNLKYGDKNKHNNLVGYEKFNDYVMGV